MILFTEKRGVEDALPSRGSHFDAETEFYGDLSPTSTSFWCCLCYWGPEQARAECTLIGFLIWRAWKHIS